jgi:SRSO17 transposase
MLSRIDSDPIQFIGQGQWQDDRLLRQHWRLVDETLGEADGVSIVDGSDVPKHGEHSGGVARQWCGHLGKVDNCQAGVFAAYASRKGSTLLDRRLYLPEEWFEVGHCERWGKCGIPDETRFKTKQTLALERVQASVTEGGPRLRWLTGAEAFGRDGAFLDGVAALGRWYYAEVPQDTQVWLTRPPTAVLAWTARGRRPRTARLVPGAPAPQLSRWTRGILTRAKKAVRGPWWPSSPANGAWRYAQACRAQTCGWSFGVGWERTQS